MFSAACVDISERHSATPTRPSSRPASAATDLRAPDAAEHESAAHLQFEGVALPWAASHLKLGGSRVIQAVRFPSLCTLGLAFALAVAACAPVPQTAAPTQQVAPTQGTAPASAAQPMA